MSGVQAHWIKHNKAERVPSRFVVVTVQAKSEFIDGKRVESWLCAGVHTGWWTNRGVLHESHVVTTDLEELWDIVTKHMKERRRTVFYAHNLPYVMRITQALSYLPRKGLSLTAIRLSSQGTWSKWSQGQSTLTLADTASVFTCTVAKMGEFTGKTRIVPDSENPVLSALSVCERDLSILAEIVRQYLEWLKSGVAGNWAITGSSQSWNHYRHNHMTHKVLVHDDSEAKLAEREAIYSGRAENFRWGKDLTAPVYEYDFSNAYPSLARDFDIPTRLLHSMRSPTLAQVKAASKRYAVLARGEVVTDAPVVPTRTDRGILWPVGRFTSTLWEPEIEALLAAGGQFRPERAWLYRREPALAAWAAWVLGTVHDRDHAAYPWVPLVVKHWSRALIGRFALRYQDWELFGQPPSGGLSIGTLYDRRTGAVSDTMQVGTDLHVLSGYRDGDDAVPQITSYITALARVRLWNAITEVGIENVYYVDTDSLYVNARGAQRIKDRHTDSVFAGLRLKSRSRGYEIFGPKAILSGGNAKVSGLPTGSERITEQNFIGNVYSSLESGIRLSQLNHVTITQRKFQLRWNENRRARVHDGTTTPYRLPSMEPAAPTGAIRPTTTDERTRYAIRALNATQITPRDRLRTRTIDLPGNSAATG